MVGCVAGFVLYLDILGAEAALIHEREPAKVDALLRRAVFGHAGALFLLLPACVVLNVLSGRGLKAQSGQAAPKPKQR